MDNRFSIQIIARALYRRGTHRVLGNLHLGTFSAFLTLVFLIRISANIYIAIDIFLRGGILNAVQISGVHFIILAAYMIWAGSLSLFRVVFALPQESFISFSPFGTRFKKSFVRQTAVLKPMNILWIIIVLFSLVVLSWMNGSWEPVAVRFLITIAVTGFGVFIVLQVLSWARVERTDTQILEVLSLSLLIALNPDIGQLDGSVGLLLKWIHNPFTSLWSISIGAAIIVILPLILLTIFKVFSSISTRVRRQFSAHPVEGWYWRLLRLRIWIVLYLLVIPIFISPAFASTVKKWTLTLSLLFGAVSYLFFIYQCEASLQEKWRCSLLSKDNLNYITRSVVIHVVFMIVPVIGFVIGRGYIM